MNSSDIRKLLINLLKEDSDPGKISERLEKEGISYDFSAGFTEKVLTRAFAVRSVFSRETELIKYLNLAFSRIAITGIAAIIVLLISIFIMEGSLSVNSILGLSDNYDEGIVYLLTGN